MELSTTSSNRCGYESRIIFFFSLIIHNKVEENPSARHFVGGHTGSKDSGWARGWRTQEWCRPYTWGCWKGLGPRGRLRCGLWSPTYTPKHVQKVQWKNMFRVRDPPTMQPTKNSNRPWTDSQRFSRKAPQKARRALLDSACGFCIYFSAHFSQVAQSCPTPRVPMDCSTPGLPVHHQLPESTQTQVHRGGEAQSTVFSILE